VIVTVASGCPGQRRAVVADGIVDSLGFSLTLTDGVLVGGVEQ
jgi:hypothetical protein